jgi:hypothetical protein
MNKHKAIRFFMKLIVYANYFLTMIVKEQYKQIILLIILLILLIIPQCSWILHYIMKNMHMKNYSSPMGAFRWLMCYL